MIFVLDTNVLRKVRKVVELAELAGKHKHHVQIPALAYAEHLAQMRRVYRGKGQVFNEAYIEAFLQTHKLQVVPFDRPVAERCAEALADSFPAKEDWHSARRERCAHRFQTVQSDTGHPCPATVDWYLAASYSAEPFVLVTLDQGAEFKGVRVESLNSAIVLAGSV